MMREIFSDRPGTLYFGHRGLPSKERENTIQSFQAALLSGADGIELDVHLSKDEKLVVIHDYNTKRTTGVDCSIEEHTYEEIKAIDFEIPTLEDVFAAFNDKCLYDIEIKNKNKPNPKLERLVYECIKKARLEKYVMVSSFNPFSLQIFHRLDKTIPLAPIYDIDKAVPKPLQRGFAHKMVKSTALKPGIHTFEHSYEHYAKKYPLSVWCVDTREEALRMEKLGVRMIITNKVDLLLKTQR